MREQQRVGVPLSAPGGAAADISARAPKRRGHPLQPAPIAPGGRSGCARPQGRPLRPEQTHLCKHNIECSDSAAAQAQGVRRGAHGHHCMAGCQETLSARVAGPSGRSSSILPKVGFRSTLAPVARLNTPAPGTAAVLTARRGPRPQRGAPASPAVGEASWVSASPCHVRHRAWPCQQPCCPTLGKLWEPAIAFPSPVDKIEPLQLVAGPSAGLSGQTGRSWRGED